MVRRWLDRALDLLFPPKCTFCHEILEGEYIVQRVCEQCREKMEVCRSRVEGEFIDRGVACFSYEGNVRKSIQRFKFNGRKEYAPIYVGYMLRRLDGEDELKGADLITHVPTNRQNERKRGYNHAALLAYHLAEALDLPAVDTLAKIRETQAMYGLQQHERRANILGSIKISCEAERIRGKKVLLVDDIFTTGATVGECARVLRMAGAEKVFVITVAKTEKSY